MTNENLLKSTKKSSFYIMIMGETVEFLKPPQEQLMINLLLLLTAITFFYLLHILDQVQYLGSFQMIYVPILILLLELIKNTPKLYSTKRDARKSTFSYIWKSLLVFSSTILGSFIVIILLGAPAFSQYEETAMLALSLTTTTFLNCLINEGLINTCDLRSNTISPCKTVAAMSIFGCWSSAVVIPLDWSRWWQKWPIPCVSGTFLGYVAGYIVLVLLGLLNFKRTCRNLRKHV